MTELKYWTGNLVAGDDIFFVLDTGELSPSVVTIVTDTTFCMLATDTPFDKSTARNQEDVCALPYDTEHRDIYFSQQLRAKLAALNMGMLSDRQVAHMIAGLKVSGGAHAKSDFKPKMREQLMQLDVNLLSDREVSYIVAGLKLADNQSE